MRDDVPNLAVVHAANLVDLLEDLAAAVDDAGIQLMVFLEALEIRHRDAVVEVVGARREDVLAVAGRLAGHHRLEVGIEEHPREALDALGDRLAGLEIEAGTVDGGDFHRLDQLPAIEPEQELPGRQVVVRSGVQPEQLGVASQLFENVVGNPRRVPDDLLEHFPDAEVVAVALVVVDVTAGERGAVKMPDEGFLPQRQLLKAIGVQLHDRGIVNLLEQVAPVGVYSGRSAF